MKAKINLDTMQQINKFVKICSTIPYKIVLTDGQGYTVSAKSLLGAIATTDWNSVYCECEYDIYTKISEFVI